MKIIILNKNNLSQVINHTIKIFKKGGLVIFPSDTVYGALVDATNQSAIKKLIDFKSRPPGKPISVFVNGFKMLEELVEFNHQQRLMLTQILPGPFTVVLNSKHKLSRLLESEKGSLGMRIPSYQLINQLIQKFGKPVTATSANLSGYPAHYSVESLMQRLSQQKEKLIDLVVDAGKLPRNKPSTVIDLTQAKVKILRQGEIVFKDKKTFISKSPEQTKSLASYIVQKLINKKLAKPLIFIIEGELGVGKTVFVKGIGDFLGVKDIVSPSFVVYYEYPVKVQSPLRVGGRVNRLIHIDLYNIEETEEFKYLGIEKYLDKGNLLCFEWGEKAGEIYQMLKSKGKIVYIKMKYINEKLREINILNIKDQKSK